MAKDIAFNLKFDSNGNAVMSKLTIQAKGLSEAVAIVQKQTSKTFSSFAGGMASFTVALDAGVKGLNQLAAPVMEFDQAMRAANTMASKGAKDFENLKKQVKELSKEVPVARDVLANGLYQTISNGVPEDNWLSFLKTSAESSVGGLANLDEVVKVTSTVIKNYG